MWFEMQLPGCPCMAFEDQHGYAVTMMRAGEVGMESVALVSLVVVMGVVYA